MLALKMMHAHKGMGAARRKVDSTAQAAIATAAACADMAEFSFQAVCPSIAVVAS
jgi:hypothetical protein